MFISFEIGLGPKPVRLDETSTWFQTLFWRVRQYDDLWGRMATHWYFRMGGLLIGLRYARKHKVSDE